MFVPMDLNTASADAFSTIPGMSAVALPIVTGKGRTVAAIGIGAINDRMNDTRIEGELLPLLRREVALLTVQFDALEAEGLL